MQRLTGLDDTFLWLETPSSYMHVASLITVDAGALDTGWSFERVKAHYQSRLDEAPPFRRRLVQVPFGLHHPLWIEDPDFDLGWHLRQITLPEGRNSFRDLAEMAAKLNAIHLDRTRPLWEMWMIDGVEGGLVGLLTKVHHAAIDGASGEELMVAILDLEPDPEPRAEPATPWHPDPVPTDTELITHAAWSLAQQPIKAAGAVKRTIDAVLRVREQNRQPNITPPPAPFSAPTTSFNGPLTPARSFAAASLPLSRVKAVKNAFGCTVNDVVLTMCAGALRRYLDERSEELDNPLVAMVPMSVRTDDQKGTPGNRVTSMLTSLATDLDDPVARLDLIHASMQVAKEQTDAIGADTLQDWAEFAAPAIFGRAARLYSNTKMADLHRPLFNVTVSNVPGPPFPLYVAGARMTGVYPLGPIFDGGALNITLMSYLDSLDFGLVACPDLLPDVWRIADGLGEALDELSAAADRRLLEGREALRTAKPVKSAKASAEKKPRTKKTAKKPAKKTAEKPAEEAAKKVTKTAATEPVEVSGS